MLSSTLKTEIVNNSSVRGGIEAVTRGLRVCGREVKLVTSRGQFAYSVQTAAYALGDDDLWVLLNRGLNSAGIRRVSKTSLIAIQGSVLENWDSTYNTLANNIIGRELQK